MILNGWLMVRSGEADRGVAQMRDGIAAWRSDAKAMVSHWLLLLASALGKIGELRASLDVIDDGLALTAETNERWKETGLHLHKGELLLAFSANDKAERRFRARACRGAATTRQALGATSCRVAGPALGRARRTTQGL